MRERRYMSKVFLRARQILVLQVYTGEKATNKALLLSFRRMTVGREKSVVAVRTHQAASAVLMTVCYVSLHICRELFLCFLLPIESHLQV